MKLIVKYRLYNERREFRKQFFNLVEFSTFITCMYTCAILLIRIEIYVTGFRLEYYNIDLSKDQ